MCCTTDYFFWLAICKLNGRNQLCIEMLLNRTSWVWLKFRCDFTCCSTNTLDLDSKITVFVHRIGFIFNFEHTFSVIVNDIGCLDTDCCCRLCYQLQFMMSVFQIRRLKNLCSCWSYGIMSINRCNRSIHIINIDICLTMIWIFCSHQIYFCSVKLIGKACIRLIWPGILSVNISRSRLWIPSWRTKFKLRFIIYTCRIHSIRSSPTQLEAFAGFINSNFAKLRNFSCWCSDSNSYLSCRYWWCSDQSFWSNRHTTFHGLPACIVIFFVFNFIAIDMLSILDCLFDWYDIKSLCRIPFDCQASTCCTIICCPVCSIIVINCISRLEVNIIAADIACCNCCSICFCKIGSECILNILTKFHNTIQNRLVYFSLIIRRHIQK